MEKKNKKNTHTHRTRVPHLHTPGNRIIILFAAIHLGLTHFSNRRLSRKGTLHPFSEHRSKIYACGLVYIRILDHNFWFTPLCAKNGWPCPPLLEHRSRIYACVHVYNCILHQRIIMHKIAAIALTRLQCHLGIAVRDFWHSFIATLSQKQGPGGKK